MSVTNTFSNKTRIVCINLYKIKENVHMEHVFRFAVPDVPLSVPQAIDCKSLNDLVNQLIKECNSDYLKPKQFDFLVLGEILRVPLIEHLQERNVSTESTVDIEYVVRTPAPEPEDSLLHDDWVSGIQAADKWYQIFKTDYISLYYSIRFQDSYWLLRLLR